MHGQPPGVLPLPSSEPRRAQVGGRGKDEGGEDKEAVLLPFIQNKGPFFSP